MNHFALFALTLYPVSVPLQGPAQADFAPVIWLPPARDYARKLFKNCSFFTILTFCVKPRIMLHITAFCVISPIQQKVIKLNLENYIIIIPLP